MSELAGGASAGGNAGRVVLIASASSAVMTAGIQGVAPAIPAIQAEFSITAAQVGLFTSVYLFPSMFSALAAGVLADRIGIRPVLAGCLLIFGLTGLAVLFVDDLPTLLATRFVQGAAFGAVLSLTVSVIGNVMPAGRAAARAQGQRVVLMAVCEAIFPILGGLLVVIAWSAPFALHALAIPLAVLTWRTFPRGAVARELTGKASVTAVLHAPALLGVQLLAAMRFLFKFGVITYFPVLGVSMFGMSAATVGLALGASSVVTALMAWQTERLATRWSSARVIAGCLVVASVSLVAMGTAQGAELLVVGLLLFGVQDGLYGVSHNVLVTEMAPAAIRSTYVGLTGTVRNVGKFVAPVMFGGLTLVVPLAQSFLIMGGLSLGSAAVAQRVARVQEALRATDDPGGEPGPDVDPGGSQAKPK